MSILGYRETAEESYLRRIACALEEIRDEIRKTKKGKD